jgi:hypothetical protein
MKRKTLVLLLTSLCISTAFSQNERGFSPSFRLSGHTGLLIPHRVAMQHLPEAPTRGIEANMEFGGREHMPWSKMYNHPVPGVSLYASSLGNDKVLGYGIGICPYLLIPHIRTQKFNLYSGWGWGVGYVTRHWHRTDNYKNIVTGSRINIYINIKLMAEWQITPRWAFFGYSAFNHFSNSNIAQPNLGINSPTLGAGISWRRHPKVLPDLYTRKERRILAADTHKLRWQVIPTAGVRARNTTDNRLHAAYNLGVSAIHSISLKSRVGGGLDLFYNTAIQKNLELAGKSTNKTQQVGVFAQYEHLVGRTSLIISMGAYVFDQSERQDPMYHRLGTRVWINDYLFINTTLHAHWAVADHMEFGLGYSRAR